MLSSKFVMDVSHVLTISLSIYKQQNAISKLIHCCLMGSLFDLNLLYDVRPVILIWLLYKCSSTCQLESTVRQKYQNCIQEEAVTIFYPQQITHNLSYSAKLNSNIYIIPKYMYFVGNNNCCLHSMFICVNLQALHKATMWTILQLIFSNWTNSTNFHKTAHKIRIDCYMVLEWLKIYWS